MSEFDLVYAELLSSVMLSKGYVNKRTGHQVKAEAGALFGITANPLLQLRDIKPLWFVVETVASIAGCRDLDLFHEFGLKAWDKFADIKGNVESMYGWRWRSHFNRDQFLDLLTGLGKDNSTRHGVLITWDPANDGLYREQVSNVPCVVAWHFHVINNGLHLTVMQRSGDLVVGVPHDIASAWLLLELMAAHLLLDVGSLTYVISNAHIYDSHYKLVNEMLDNAKHMREVGGRHSTPKVQPSMGCIESILSGNCVDVVNKLYSFILSAYEPMPTTVRPEVIL